MKKEVIKLFKADFLYPNFLKYFYERNRNSNGQSYQRQYDDISQAGIGMTNYWKMNLEKMGNYEVFESYINVEFLQKQWAKEHGVFFSEDTWILDILEAQIAEFKPHIFFSHDTTCITSQFRRYIKKKYRTIVLIIGWDGTFIKNVNYFDGCDLILSCGKFVSDYYKQNGKLSFYFPFGFEDSVLKYIHKHKRKKYNVSFIGSVTTGVNRHNNRLKLLSELSRRISLEIWSSKTNPKEYVTSQLDRLREGKIQELKDFYQIQKITRGEIFGREMFQTLADSKIGLNVHIDTFQNFSGNMRLFETTGMGACLVTEYTKNIGELFELDKEVVPYVSIDDCEEKLKYLLSHSRVCSDIALAGQKKTLKNYTYGKRIKDFSDYLLRHL